MASNYDRILASRQRFREQANLTQDDYAAFQQAYVQKFDAKDLAQGTRQAADALRQALQKPAGVSKPETLRKAYNNYESYMQKVRAYTKAGGQLGGGSFLQMQEEDFAKQREDFTKLLQESIQMRKGTQGALGRITAAGARVDDAALREATTANKLPGLLDEKTGLPTQAAWAAWEKNRLRTAYQDAAQTAGQQQAAITQRQKQQADEAERLEGVKNVLWRLLDAKEPQLVRYHDAIVKQQAKLAGISDYRDAADLQRQVETRLGRLGRIQDRTAARAADKAGEVRTARALEYQLDNPSESLDANALKWERDQAAREAARGLTLHSAANFLRANHAYAQRRYTDEKWKDISAIRNDQTLSGDYQTALEATRAAKAAEEALGYIQSDLHRDGAVTRDTAMQARHIAAQAGITLPDDDAALAGYLARLSKQEGARLQYALAGLTAAGYDEKKLRQYIKQALNAQQMDEYTAAARESAAAHPVGTSFASAAANLVGGMGYLAALPRTAANTWAAATGNYDAYIPIDENANSFRATKYAQTVREEVARQLQEKYPDGEFLGQNSAAFLYDTGMSMLDNITQVMMGMGLLGAGAMQEAASGGVAAMVRAGTAAASPVSLGVMGLTTASQKLQELTEQGVDATTAYTLATAAGSIEVLTEKIGLDEFVNGLGRQTAATTLRQLGKQLGRQMLAEGTEEAASDILNLAADALVRWDQNDFAKAIEEKRRQGYNEGDAVWACIGDQLLSTAGSFAGGALSGAGFGLGGFAMNAASNTNTALGRAAQSAAGFADLQRAAEAYGVDLGDLTQASSAQALGALRRQVLAAAEQEAKQVDAFAKQKGYKKNAADALQTAFASYRDTGANGMTAAEFAVAFDTAYQEGRLDAQYGNPGAYLRRAAQDGLTAGLPGKTIQYAYLTGTQDGAKQTAKLGNPIRAVRDAAAERRAQAATNTPKGKLRVIALDEDTATVQTADGKRVGLDKLAADSAQRKIILQAQDDGYGAQVANAMLDGYDGRMPPERYYEAYRDAMTAAWAGESLQSVLRDAGTALPAKSAKAAWETGRAIAARDAMRERIGPAGQQLLDRLAPEQAELFEKYYKAGLAGKHFDQARKEIGQADAGQNSTLRAAVRAGARDAQGGFTDGRQNSGDGQGRQGSVDPGGRGTRVAEGAAHERSGAGAAEERAAGEAAGQDTGAAQVSTKALGVPEGTDRATARVIPTEEQTPAQRAKAAEYAKAGAELVLIEGNLEIQGETGTMHARGARIGDRIIASVNDEGATWEQIARHEEKHRYFEQHPDAVQQEWERVTGYMDADSVEEWLAYYAGKYAALGDIVDIAYIQEEALCDLAAEIETGKATEKDYRALETVKARAQKNTAQAGRTKMSFSGKYWRPNLNKTEWELLHRHVEREIGDRAHTLDEATKWLYASEKGAQVFALYGIGDGTEATPLYAVGGKTAERRYKELQACMEEIKNGTDRDATTVNQWLDRVQSAKRNHRAHLPATGGRTAANRNDSVHGGPSERDRGGAFATGEEDGRSEGGTVYSVENEADAAAATETDRARKLEDLARELDAAQKAMTAEELRAIQSIGNQSVNQFTSEDIRRGRILYDVSRVHRIDKKSGSGKHTATGESQRSRYQEPGTGRTQSEATKSSIVEKTRSVKTRFAIADVAETKGETENDARRNDRQTLQEYEVQTALWDAMDHADRGNDNVIKLGRMPRYVRTLTGIDGDFYIYRNHAYENMATREQAERDGRPTRRGRQDIHFHGLGIDTMTEAILRTEDPLVTIWEKSKDGNPVISMVLPVKDADGAPLYAVMGFYTRNRINGKMKVRPHVLLTISNRPLFGEGRRGTVETINDAIAEKRILGMADIKKVRANLTLTSQHTKLTGITVNALSQNVAQFQREVKQFRAKNKINYSAASTRADGAAAQDATQQDLARELDDALKRNKALESVNRRLREQMKVTPPGTADPASLRRAAKQLSEEYGGALRQKDIAADLQKIWRLRSEQKRGPMLEQVDKLAAELVQHYLDKDNPEAETLREIKQTVRATKIHLTPELRGDLDRDGGYQDFRRRNFGRIRLANSGLGVDQFYQELSEQWPAYFPAGIWNPADQLLQIADVIQDGTTVLQRSPMEAFPDGMTYMRNKVLWELGLVQDAKPTAADKVIRQAADAANRDALLDAAAAHEQEQMDKLDAWYREKLQKVKADREDRIQKVKDRYQERAQADRDWKAEQELKRRLLWHGNRLKRMGRTATPEQQAEIERIFGDINLACQRMTGEVVIKDYIQGMSTEEIRPEGYRDKADPRRTMSVEEGFWHPEVRGDKVVDVERLKVWYEEQKKTNPDFIADRRVEDILANWEKKQINTMSPREVQQLLDVALNIENEIRTQKKLIDAEDRREVYQQVLEVIGDIESTRGRGDRNLPKVIGAVKDGGRWLVDGTLTPVRLLRRFTGYQDSDPLYRAALALQQGELKQLDYQRRAYARFEGFTKDRKFMDYLAGKGKQKPIEITGMNERGEQVTCRITPDMRVALYLHSKNYQNLRHIQRGGIEIPDYAAYVAGRYTDAYDKATRLRLAPGTVRAIGETMTTREKNYAEEIRNYYNTMSKAEINAVSVKLKGYEVAKVGEYYPIATNRDFVVKEFDAIKYDGSLESFGFLKERKEGGTPILLADATRTLERSIQSHAAYIGMAIPMRNFNKLRGVSILDSTEAGEVRYQKQSLMDTLRKQWGTNAVKRLETMVADLSGSKPRENGMGMLNRIRSNYAGAVLELNPSTGMKQLIAYPSAASVLGWDAMAVGLTKWQKVDVKLIGRYTPLLWHRMQGFIDADLGDYAKNHGHTPRFLNWNQAGDLAVVKQIWKAAEWKVAHDDQTLLHDVEKWHKATAELFNRVVLESQANYTTMERGELLRTNNVFWRSITMFKTEPFQAFNVLYDGFANVAAKRRQLAAAQQLENEEGGKEKAQAAEAAYRAAKKRVAQAVPAVIASNLLEAAITFAWALFRGKDKDWRDEESDEITAASFFKKMFIQAGSNIAGIVPLGGQLSEAAQAAIFGDRYYGMETTEVSIIDDTINSLLHIRGSIANMIEAGKTEEEAERARKVRAARDDFFKTLWDESMRLSVSIGVPVGNGEKILKGIFRWAFVAAMGKNEGEYWFRYCTEKSTASGRGGADADALFRAALDGDEESMDRMYAAMAKTKSEDSIQAAMRKRTKDAVDSGDVDLETAVGILQRLQTDKAADDLYWDVRGWQYMAQTGAESFGKYNILKDAIFSGGDAAAALQELEAHGVSREDAEGEIRSTIGQWYQGKSADGRTVDQAKAQQLLRDYGGMDAEDAEKTVAKWRCYVETGVAYDEIKTGVLDGSITEQEAAQWLQKYGGKDEKSAAETARKYAFLAENPALAGIYGDEEIEKAAGKYAKYGSGIPAERFVKYLQEIDALSGDPDGKGGYISGSRKKKVVAYIAALPLTAAQKDAMMLADYANYSLKGMPW